MTKEEVRAVILSKLRLKPDAVVWDLGAGTGSVSIECARMCPFGEVYAVEYKPEALDILEQNKTRFQTKNLQIIAGRAEEQVQHLPVPDCVFLGGSSGAAKQLVAGLRQLRQPVRLVASAVTMETQAELFRCCRNCRSSKWCSWQSAAEKRWEIITCWRAIIRCCCSRA